MPRTLRLPRSKRTYARLAFPDRLANTRNAGGFTLIELLVVMMIIAILASMVSFAMFRSQQTARKAATQALITKLHSVIARQWDTYATRRIQWDPTATPASTSGMDPHDAAQFELAALRQLTRLELPNRWEDVSNGVTALNNTNPDFPYLTSPETPPTLALPALTQAYGAYGSGTDEHQGAECLYMIVSFIADDDLDRINLFSEGEVGDEDGDGKNEFHDAWGNPIRFLRGPMGFVDPNPSDPAWGHLSDLQTADSAGSPDPFDPRGVDTRGTWAIYPLIYSAGPDQTYDIYTGTGSSDDPYAGIDQTHTPMGTTGTQIGAPLDASNAQVAPDNGKLNHHDNIHNHRLGGSLR